MDLVVVLQGISLACKQGQHTRLSVYSSASRCQMLASVEAEAAAGHPDEVTFELPPPENVICPKVWGFRTPTLWSTSFQTFGQTVDARDATTFFILGMPLDVSTTSRMRLLRQLQADG
jgi:hypothetical protein